MLKLFKWVFGLGLLVSTIAYADGLSEQADVRTFIQKMVTEYHFNQNSLNTLFDQINFDPRVVKLMGRQYEAKPWYQYKPAFVNPQRIKQGIAFSLQQHTLLQKIQQQFNVNSEIVVATVGIETNYGRDKGSFNTLNTLTTLAFDYPKRAAFFQNELKEYLLFTRENHIDPQSIKGSYAGAMGYGQFMPSNYRAYGVDITGDHQVDLVNNLADALASTANYYHQSGWLLNAPVIILANVSKNAKPENYIVIHKETYTLAELAKAGITPQSGHYPMNTKVGLIPLESTAGVTEYWIAFHNFYVIKRYNPSDKYAMAIYTLSQAITPP